jgi:flagellar biosynthesis protein FlhG
MTEANECVIATQIPNLKLLAGSSGVFGAANITYAEKTSILRKLRALDADIVVVDVGAGVSYNALDFFDLGARKLVVTTPQVTALHDAYAFLKSAVLRLLRQRVEDAIDVALLEPATLSTSTEKVVQVLGRLRQIRPELGQKLFAAMASFGACMIGNQVMSDAHAGVFKAVAQTMREYLGLEVPVLGWLRSSTTIHESVNRRRPLTLDPNGKDAAGFRKLARTIADNLPAADQDLGIVEDIAIDEPSAA